MTSEKSKISKEEVEKIVLELGKKGMTSEKIGLQISKEHKIRPKTAGMKISSMLKKGNTYTFPDKANIKKRIETLKSHIEKNKHDYSARRALITEESRIRNIK